MQRYLCIHGHYYQPPRENPWLEAIEAQQSAYPYHDWNERIDAECYGPNAAARILDGEGRIIDITNNYARTSFNFGPTLLSWLEDKAPETYAAVLEGDRLSRERFNGHGSAMAQAYNHMILPLANARDKRTQITWGIRDFEHRYGRKPEGMWLPETAVDIESLDMLARRGIAFTVLAPRQASRVRASAGRAWRDVSGGRIDPTRAYVQRLPSGRSISLFFYDGPISQAVAFEGLLGNGETFANRLMSGFNDQRTWPQIVHIATDGETYGHHHRHGEMALAFALERVQEQGLARLTNYGEYLEVHPATHLVDIFENSSWSCVHGVERWRADCGCSTGANPGWNQQWRAPLRDSLDWLRDELAPLYERGCGPLFRDAWEARDAYIDVILDRSAGSVDRFFAEQQAHELSADERTRALKLLELQRHAMLMYTSCGWFFDELSGIETVQVIEYAGRCIQLARDLFEHDAEPEFLRRLSAARSNIPENGNGADVYEHNVRPAMVDLPAVAAHYAVTSLFEPEAKSARVYCYDVEPNSFRMAEAGRAKAAVGRASVTSVITGEHEDLSFGVVHFGDHVVSGGVRPFEGSAAFDTMADEVMTAFGRADLAGAILLLDRHFYGLTYSLRTLFRDEQQALMRRILQPVLDEAESMFRTFYERNAPLMRFIAEIGMPLPHRFHVAAELALNQSLQHALDGSGMDTPRVQALLEEARSAGVTLDASGLALSTERALLALAQDWKAAQGDEQLLARLSEAAELVHGLPFAVDLWRVQNIYWAIAGDASGAMAARATAGHADATAWLQTFAALGERLGIQPPVADAV